MINELRIGNWLNIANTETDTTVTASTFSIGQLINVNYKPIKIDVFWLKRFGFKYNGFVYVFNKHQLRTVDKGESYIYWVDSVYKADVKYVHELQNLYFALTKEELTLNKKVSDFNRTGKKRPIAGGDNY